jgi:hypothetical protein
MTARSYGGGGLSLAASYGLGTGVPTQTASELHTMARGGSDDQVISKFWNPGSPLFWVGGILAATLGLAAISGSGSVRVGPVHASASAGAGK